MRRRSRSSSLAFRRRPADTSSVQASSGYQTSMSPVKVSSRRVTSPNSHIRTGGFCTSVQVTMPATCAEGGDEDPLPTREAPQHLVDGGPAGHDLVVLEGQERVAADAGGLEAFGGGVAGDQPVLADADHGEAPLPERSRAVAAGIRASKEARASATSRT